MLARLSKYFTNQYWFQTGFVNPTRSDLIFFSVALILFVAAIGFSIFNAGVKNRLLKDLIGRWIVLGYTIGGLGLIWSGLRYQAILSLSAHVVIISFYIIGLVWAGYLIKYWRGDYKKLQQVQKQEMQKQKYM